MYFPYFRGKQFELIAIRDTATLLAEAEFTPIIEPVKEALKGLGRALDAVCESGGRAIVIVNPHHGSLAGNGAAISSFLEDGYLEKDNISAGILLKDTTSVAEAVALYDNHADHSPYFIHMGFLDENDLVNALGAGLDETRHIFQEQTCPVLYRKKFSGASRVMLRDSFNKQRNSGYPPVELFSDLHVTFSSELGLQGFGDFLTVGDEYSETGGPAYAVAIHMTFIDPQKDDQMYVYHFISDTNSTPTDPAGKFAEALGKLVAKYKSGSSHLYHGNALQELLALHEKQHFPGLGQVKKLSMIHHIETLANYLPEAD